MRMSEEYEKSRGQISLDEIFRVVTGAIGFVFVGTIVKKGQQGLSVPVNIV